MLSGARKFLCGLYWKRPRATSPSISACRVGVVDQTGNEISGDRYDDSAQMKERQTELNLWRSYCWWFRMDGWMCRRPCVKKISWKHRFTSRLQARTERALRRLGEISCKRQVILNVRLMFWETMSITIWFPFL